MTEFNIDSPLQSLMQSGLMGVSLNDNASPAANVLYSSLKSSSSTGGTTPYIVSSSGPYTTIQAAINAASTAGGGVIYVKPGTYAENLNFLPGVVLSGGFASLDVGSITSPQSIIAGIHTFDATATYIGFKDLVFTGTGGGTTPVFTLAPTTNQLDVDIRNCVVDSGLNSSTPTSLFSLNGTLQPLNVYLTNSSVTISGAVTGTCVAVGPGGRLYASYCKFVSFGDSCITLTSNTSIVFSSYNSYQNGNTPCVLFPAFGTMVSTFDTYDCNSVAGNYIDGTTGSLNITAPALLGTATKVNPLVGYAPYPMGDIEIRGNLTFNFAGNRQFYNSLGSGTAAGDNSAGTVALVGGTIVVSTTAVSASSLFRLTCQALGTVVNPSALTVTTKVVGTSFTIKASQATDTSTIFWEILN